MQTEGMEEMMDDPLNAGEDDPDSQEGDTGIKGTNLFTQDPTGSGNGEAMWGPEGLTLVDVWNGFNELSRLAMLWMVRHCWPAGAQFAFNCYRHFVQLILCHPGQP